MCLCKFTFAWVVDMPRRHGHCKLVPGWGDSGNFLEKCCFSFLKKFLKVLDYYFQLFVCTLVACLISTFNVAVLHVSREWFHVAIRTKTSLQRQCSSYHNCCRNKMHKNMCYSSLHILVWWDYIQIGQVFQINLIMRNLIIIYDYPCGLIQVWDYNKMVFL